MVDFVGILKNTINAQKDATPKLRERVYERATETLEHKIVNMKLPKEAIEAQRRALQSAITTVEEEYLAVEKELLSSIMGWNYTEKRNDEKNAQNSLLSLENDGSVLVTEKQQQQLSVTNSVDNEIFDNASVISDMPDAKLVNIDSLNIYEKGQNIEESMSKNALLASNLQADNSHIVSHIFSQALRRANRSSLQKRILIGVIVFFSLIILFSGTFFVSGRIFISGDQNLQEKNIQISNTLQKAAQTNRKLTQRLLEDGSEVDVGPAEKTVSSSEEGTSTVVATNLKLFGQVGEAVLYQMRTKHDAEKVTKGSASWSLIEEDSVKGASGELALRGDITIPSEGLSLRLTLRRNTDESLCAAYIIDLIFITSDKFSGQTINNIKSLTFKANEKSIGQTLFGTVTAKIDNDFFLFALTGNHPFLDRNLQLIRDLDWLRLVMSDKNGRVHELTFAKGPAGEAIFNKVIGQWLMQKNKS
ncbi:conserved protein of unknown function [Bartonella clarridgeiae 73]|uniref:Transmembrane protein n=1 Tax=Bartonella clarridgeiae (strain CCUG 45776 / CIP 104772 / 73) TaxID=696125 RepID=E6YGB9_BARC7|nr:hypothetical protein [Bartonella clarridgeiae]WCR55486.1 MAG: hypothetical protein PG977_000879 [Bartonella clarridgeiae]CBI75907.1 conserved protein of unknown function [Bartonella clarridgeiae 73]